MADMTKQKITVAEFESFLRQPENRDRLFELIEGEIVEKVTAQQHGIIVAFLITEISIYLRQNPIGRVGPEISFRLPTDLHNFRQPDISFTSGIDKPVSVEAAMPYMPDLAVEVKSPSDTYKSIRDRADYYLANGAKMVWMIFPEKKFVEVWTPDEQDMLNENDILNGGTILPGFQLAVSQIFAAA